MTFGVVVGLVVGRPLGVFVPSFLAVKLGLAQLPAGVGGRGVFGVGFLAGIGLTMSLFIAGLSFGDDLCNQARHLRRVADVREPRDHAACEE